MGKAFADMLPYTLGLIVSPFPVVAVIALLISANGRAKALLFEVTWLLMSWVVLVVLILLLGAIGATGHAKPVWVAWLALIIGILLLAMVVAGIRRAARRKESKAPEVPRWIAAMDTMTIPKIVGVAALLIVANPVNLASLAGGAIAAAHEPLPLGRQIVLAAVFVVIGSIGVLAPYATALTSSGGQRLQRMRGWLIRHNGALTLLLILVFALLFLAKGLRGLLA
ncbi:GAP family protein [Nonomuraea fuscirosea]|uniref:GAP family protein n=1 Tax=Nonomuraea fuscirosea TaxID=1291556 RepID=UPI002DDBA5F7|nr:GAP family protein [Nonomuraea fuscirosea]WSA50006.1 GAP family protein [Nonomuraea fuscirosea]